jgi:hypothetical protein
MENQNKNILVWSKMSAPKPKVAAPKVAIPKVAVPKAAIPPAPKVAPKVASTVVAPKVATKADIVPPKVATKADVLAPKVAEPRRAKELKACGPNKLVVLDCCHDEHGKEVDIDERLCQQRKNMALAGKMLKEAMEAGHIEKDDKGMYVRRCSGKCNCLPVVPSSIRAQKTKAR